MEYFNYNSEKILLCDANEYFGTAHLERESDHKIPFLQQRAMILSLLRENGYADATIQGFQNQNTSYFVKEAIYKIAQDTAVTDITGPDEVKYDKRGEAIDFKATIEYLKNYANKDYKKPAREADPVKRAEFEALKEQGQKARGEMIKMGDVCCDKFNLTPSDKPNWRNGANTNKIAYYLWVRLCWQNNKGGPDYISLFAQRDGKFEFALELDGKKVRRDDYQSFLKKHHTFLELPIKAEDNLTFVQEHNQKNYDPAKLNQEREDILSQINSDTWDGGKIRLSRVIEDSDEITNDDYYQAMLEAVQSLIPYYNHVLGLDRPSPEQGQEQKQELVPEQEQEPGQEPEHNPVTPSNLQKNLILYGPPGTGKTYVSKIYAVDICKPTYNGKTDVGKYENYAEVAKEYERLVGENRICFTTFHQSYGYEEFVEGIKPVLHSNDVKYELSDGLFKSFCEKARKRPKDNYVFVIDEINRGNISKIFGELITLIESSKREGMPEETSCILPYSQEPFTIPQNVYILGTMNTADRSIAMMDTALRRRFDFIEMMPDHTKITAVITEGGQQLKVSEMLETMNKRIELLYDREHTIGHSFFMSLNDDPTVGNLADIFKNRIIPLLQEYFYDDYSKIKLVLGASGIIKEENVKTKDYFTEYDKEEMVPEKNTAYNTIC